MKKLVLTALLATVMVTPFGVSSAFGNHTSDTPECCQKKESCCPSQACCKGGSHSMCMMHMHAATN